MKETIKVRNATESEFKEIGNLMVKAYSDLNGFPNAHEQPAYYDMLANIGEFVNRPKTELIVAVNDHKVIGGAVVYFSDMHFYGSGGTATQVKNASGFRLLAVNPEFQGSGIGTLLTKECIHRAKLNGSKELVIHTTASMKIAWRMYEKMGFKRSEDLDFNQGELEVFGFRLMF